MVDTVLRKGPPRTVGWEWADGFGRCRWMRKNCSKHIRYSSALARNNGLERFSGTLR
jgi:hypothetical protein